MNNHHIKYEEALANQLAAINRKRATIHEAYRFDDYILVIRKDRQKFKLPASERFKRAALVVDGKLPNAALVETGKIAP